MIAAWLSLAAGWALAHPVTLLVFGALAVLLAILTAVYLLATSEQGAHHASRPVPRSRAGRMTRAGRWALVAARRLPGAITTLPNRGDAQGRDVRERASATGESSAEISRRAARAHMTGSLSPRPPQEGHRAASAPPSGATWARKAIGRRIQALRKWSWIAREGAAARLPGRLASHVDPFCRGMRRYTRRRTIARRIQALRTWWAFTRPRRQPSTEERQAMALLQQMRDEDTGGFLALPAPGVTVKIGAADVRAAGRTLQRGPAPCEPGPLDYQPAPPLASMLSDETIARGMQAVK